MYGEWRCSSIILGLGTRWRWSASCPGHLTSGKDPSVPTGYEWVPPEDVLDAVK
jgi:hypothetical protein